MRSNAIICAPFFLLYFRSACLENLPYQIPHSPHLALFPFAPYDMPNCATTSVRCYPIHASSTCLAALCAAFALLTARARHHVALSTTRLARTSSSRYLALRFVSIPALRTRLPRSTHCSLLHPIVSATMPVEQSIPSRCVHFVPLCKKRAACVLFFHCCPLPFAALTSTAQYETSTFPSITTCSFRRPPFCSLSNCAVLYTRTQCYRSIALAPAAPRTTRQSRPTQVCMQYAT